MNLFRQLLAVFTPPITSPAELEYLKICKSRRSLDDGEFHKEYYATTNHSLDTCSRVRHVLRTQLNMYNVRPDDNVAEIFDDIDIREICFEIGEEFQLSVADDMIDGMDGSVDSIIQMMERLRMAPHNGNANLAT